MQYPCGSVRQIGSAAPSANERKAALTLEPAAPVPSGDGESTAMRVPPVPARSTMGARSTCRNDRRSAATGRPSALIHGVTAWADRGDHQEGADDRDVL